MLYRLFVPSQTVGAGVVFFDLFNATGTACELQLVSVVPVVSGAVAATGLVAVDVFLTRTTAVGTGGTAATFNGTSLTACTISSYNNSQALPSGVTARLTPSGGATAGAVLAWASVYTEEANAGTYAPANDLVKPSSSPEVPYIPIPMGQGVRVVQGAVASVGTVGFNVLFRLVPK